MSIDWTTLLAQIANFALLVWLLQRFLYKPIRGIMAEREQKVTEKIRQGESMQEEALRHQQMYKGKQRELETTREQYLQAVRDEAEQLRRELKNEAIRQADAQRTYLAEELRREKEEFEQELQERVLVQACEIAQNVVRDLTHHSLEGALIDVLARKVDAEVSSENKPEFSVPSEQKEIVTVRTSFEPTDEQKERLAQLAAKVTGSPSVDVEFAVEPGLVFGVEMIGTQEAVSWSARDYINALQEVALDRLIQRLPQAKTGAAAGD